MTIDGTDISTIGLTLSSIDGLHDLPKQKDILAYHSASTTLTKHEEQVVTVRLIGKYDTSADLTDAVEDLRVLLATAVVHNFVFPNHAFSPSAVCRDGFDVRVYGHDYKMLEVILKLTITT